MSAVTALLFVGSLLVLLWIGQRRLIYLPLGTTEHPERIGLERTDAVPVPSIGGVILQTWFVPSRATPARATLLFFNGNAGNRSYRAPFAAAMARRGVNVLLFDYRGYGGSTGSPSEAGLFADARAVRTYVLSRPDVDPARLVFFGESLGTGVAVDLAVEHPPMALVLRSPFTSLADVGARHYWFLPVRRLLWDRYDSASRVGALRCPLVIIAGDRDQVVPFELSRRLFDAAPEPKRFVTIVGGDHNDPNLAYGPEVIRAVLDELDELS
ncbi:MAG: alpha/beta hydrolase [Acidobacteriota bacterium]